MNKTAIIYARVSTARQADEGISIDSQIERSLKKAAELGAAVLNIFKDEGRSGRSAEKRPAFQSAVQYCELNHVDYFVVWSTSRFARNKLDAASYKRVLAKAGTRVVYVSVDIDSSTDEGWFSESLLEIVDEHYSRQISRDTKRSMLKNATEGYWNGGHIPLGYQVVSEGKRKRLAVSDTEAPLIREIYRRFLSGDGTKTIAQDLNRRGFLLRGKPFSKDNIRLILKNHTYTGITVFNRTSAGLPNPESDWIMKETHPAIIDQAMFVAAQNQFGAYATGSKNSGSPLSQHYFTGLLKCGRCGLAMRIETATGRNKTYSYYNCSGAQKGHSCPPRRMNAEELDKYLLDLVLEKILRTDMVTDFVQEVQRAHFEKHGEREARKKMIQQELQDVRHRRQSLLDVLETAGAAAANLPSLLQRAAELDAREKSLLEEQAEVSNEPEFPPIDETDLKEAAAVLKHIIRSSQSIAKVRNLLQHFIEKIEISDNELSVYYRPELIINEKSSEPETVQSWAIWLPELGSNQRPAD